MISQSILKALVIVDIAIIVLSIILFDIKVLWNTQFGFVSASLVLLASMKSYKSMVDARVEHGIINIDDSKDTIDALEDPYELYSEEHVDSLGSEEKIEVQKTKASRRTLAQTLRDTKAALSLSRIGAYIVLILGFLYLNRHGLLHIPSYILALLVPMLVLVYVLLSNKETQTEDTLP